MKSVAVRLTLLGLFVAASGVAAYFFWTGERRAGLELDAARAFDAAALSAERDVLEVRAGQQAYVAAGQGDQFWGSKVAGATASLRDALTALRAKATAAQASSAIDNAASALEDFDQMDRRARDYARSGQKLLASDLIFADGLEITGAVASSLDQARAAELQARDTAIAAIHREQVLAAGGAAGVALLVVLLLVPRASVPDRSASARLEERTAESAPAGTGLNLRDVPEPLAEEPAARSSPGSTIDLGSVASLCSDLARVADTNALPAILERAAGVLDAPGIVLWIADPDGRELTPIVTHGYPPPIVSRLGTILRDAENATASAFRTSLLQTVHAEAGSTGAIAAPLVTPDGCAGVMAAEVLNEGERDPAKLAAAAIVAAQLATLVGPPVRAHSAEAAGA